MTEAFRFRPEDPTYHRRMLQTYLQGIDGSQLDQLGLVEIDWTFVKPQFDSTSTYLTTTASDIARGSTPLGSSLADPLTAAFHATARHLDERSGPIQRAGQALGTVNACLSRALSFQNSLTSYSQPPPNPDAAVYSTPKSDSQGRPVTNPDGTPVMQGDYQTDKATYEATKTQTFDLPQEKAAHEHIAALDGSFASAIEAMQAIHQQPESGATAGSAAGAAAAGSGSLPPWSGAPVGVVPTHAGPSGGWQAPPPATGTPPSHHPVPLPTGSSPGGTPPPVTRGDTGGVPWGGPGAPGGPVGPGSGGAGSVAGDPSTSGFPGGAGVGAAVLGGGLVAGAGGVAGLRALRGSVFPEGVGLGASARGAGAPGVLGGSAEAIEAEGAAGARGATVAAEPTGASGAAGAGARAGGVGGRRGVGTGAGRGPGRKRSHDSDDERGDLWDDGENWIDDEGAAPGVLG